MPSFQAASGMMRDRIEREGGWVVVLPAFLYSP